MNPLNILFFGSTNDSVLVLERLSTVNRELITISAVVTQPPKPVGRNKTITPTPVEVWAKKNNVTCLSFPSNSEKPWLFANEQQVIDALQPIGADILVSASFGIKIPWPTIQVAPYGGVNIHPSRLPHWRGADPVPWAILSGDHQTGVTVVTLSESFDEGKILAQKKIPILPSDMSDPLRTKLFDIGADLLINILPTFKSMRAKNKANPSGLPRRFTPRNDNLQYARKFKREDGFEPWPFADEDAVRIDRKWRALHPWPGIWTLVQTSNESTVHSDQIGVHSSQKRLKILKLHLSNGKIIIDEVQLEGKKPVSWEQFKKAYIP